VRHVRRDGIDGLKKSQKEGHVSEDEIKRHEAEVQKTTDAAIAEIDQTLAQKEKEIMSV
jgi:ribosome recycling factor